MARMSSDTELKIVLKRKVEIGSREHVEGFSSVTIFLRVRSSTRLKRSNLISLCMQDIGKCSVLVLLADTRSNVDYFLPEVASKLFTFRTWKLDTVVSCGP